MTDRPNRESLPALRAGICVPLKCLLNGSDFHFDAHFNFYPDGRLGELFAHPFKTGADLGTALDKFCIATSMLMQHGVRIADFWHTIDDGRTAERRDIFSAVIAGGVEEEAREIARMMTLQGGQA
jgi:hypothetical protein